MEYITFDQARKLAVAIRDGNLDQASILAKIGVEALTQITVDKFDEAKAVIDEANGEGSNWV